MPNRDGSKTAITDFFGDGEHTFDIVDPKWALLKELQEKVGSVLPFFHRLRAGNFFVDDLRELIRLGLIGGGTSPMDAARLVGAYFDLHPITSTLPIAIAITGAALYGVDDDGKPGDEDNDHTGDDHEAADVV